MGDIFHRKIGGWDIFKIVGHTQDAYHLGFQAKHIKQNYIGKVSDRYQIVPDHIWKHLYL